MSDFPTRLKAARRQLGLTQEQLAFELNSTKASISAWENGREAPRFSLLPQLSAVLQVSLDALILGEGGSVDDSASEHVVRTRNEAEVALLKAYRHLPAKRRQALLDMLG
jgi:transcriptional regulator with XRE-family HTH domain|tara:strand:+ start:34542 stop:34871 length:330 start_codon:yes stop_codon:yes gene_type:complete